MKETAFSATRLLERPISLASGVRRIRASTPPVFASPKAIAVWWRDWIRKESPDWAARSQNAVLVEVRQRNVWCSTVLVLDTCSLRSLISSALHYNGTCVSLLTWRHLYFSERFEREAVDFIEMTTDVCRALGMEFRDWIVVSKKTHMSWRERSLL